MKKRPPALAPRPRKSFQQQPLARAVALQDYLSANEGDLTISEGDMLKMTGKSEGGWTVVQNAHGAVGFVPSGL